MLSWLFGTYFYVEDITKIIEQIDKKRKEKRLKGETMNSSFSDDLKNAINGIEEIVDVEKENKKSNSDSKINYSSE